MEPCTEREKMNSVVIVQTIMIALLVNIKLINYSVTQIMNRSGEGFFSTIFLIVYIFFAISILIKKIKEKSFTKIIVSKAFIIFCSVMLFWYSISYKYTDTSVIQLICYVLFPVFICYFGNINTNLMLKMCMVFGILALPVSSRLLYSSSGTTINMDICYAFLPCIVATVIDFFSRQRGGTKITYLLYIVPMYYFTILLSRGMRGTVMCVGIAILLVILVGPNRKKYLFLSLIIFVLLFISVFFFDDIIKAIYNYYSSRGINLYFLKKTLYYENDLTNGRIILWKIAFDGFLESPLFGKGINSYNYWTGYLYPHNFLLQFMFEGGLLAIIWFLYFFIEGTINVFKYKIRQDIELYLFAFCISVPYLFVSANVWTTPLLWAFIGILLRNISIKKFKQEYYTMED